MKFWMRLIAVVPLLGGAAGFVVAVRSQNDAATTTEISLPAGGALVGNTRFCPGIPGGDLADGGWITIGNTSDASAEAHITWLTPEGHDTTVTVVDPRSSATVQLKDKQDVAAAIVEVNVPDAIVEQHSTSAAGTIRTLCTDQTATDWYFADGFTASSSDEWIVLSNPYADAAIVDVSYSTVAGRQRPNAFQGYVVPPESVKVLDVAELGARNEQVVSINVQASIGRIVAGRVQRYRGSGRQGLSVSLGITNASKDWWFGFGDTSANTAEQLVVYNPGETPVTVEVLVTGYKPKTAVVQPFSIEVPTGASSVIDMNSIGGLPSGNHAISITAVNNAAVVVERVINVIAVNGSIATTVASGIPQARLTQIWDIARINAGEKISVVNITSRKVTFSVASFGPAGDVPIAGLENLTIAPGVSMIIEIPDPAPNGPVRVRGDHNLIVEYVSSRGEGLLGYSASLAQPIAGS